MGPRGFQDLRSPSPIMAPANILFLPVKAFDPVLKLLDFVG